MKKIEKFILGLLVFGAVISIGKEVESADYAKEKLVATINIEMDEAHDSEYIMDYNKGSKALRP